ncbi:MAG: AsnC family transcriptional regulator [Anaerolineae bacterium]|nr:AsnC family transcriptional regulator [Anaerolineae bacterium]
MPARKINLDELDYQIIKLLHADARIAASEIARQTSSNERTIRKRIDRLVQDDIIRLTAILNPQAFGYITAADIFLEAEPEHEKAILNQLTSMPQVTYIAFGQGTTEMSIEARFKDNDALREFIRSTLPRIPGLTVTRYALVPRILRNIDEWMPPEDDFLSE